MLHDLGLSFTLEFTTLEGMEIQLTSPLDMHLHLRDAAMLRLVAPLSSDFAGAVIMPNLVPPVSSRGELESYAARIRVAMGETSFKPLMTLFFKNYDEATLNAVSESPDFFAVKLYPAGITTNSEGGISQLSEAEATLKMMEERGIPLLVHGESHGFVMDREAEFLDHYRYLAKTYPKLRISMEHITTAAAVELLDEYENLCATVTLQHLLITLDDLAGGMLKPHLFCKPIAKRPEDRDKLLQTALSGHPRLMFGSDSAPHPRCAKESCGCAAGVFTAPLALPKLAEVFTQHSSVEKLQAFISGNARALYQIDVAERIVTLRDTPMQVPSCYRSYGEEVVPMYAGETLPWSVVAEA